MDWKKEIAGERQAINFKYAFSWIKSLPIFQKVFSHENLCSYNTFNT